MQHKRNKKTKNNNQASDKPLNVADKLIKDIESEIEVNKQEFEKTIDNLLVVARSSKDKEKNLIHLERIDRMIEKLDNNPEKLKKIFKILEKSVDDTNEITYNLLKFITQEIIEMDGKVAIESMNELSNSIKESLASDNKNDSAVDKKNTEDLLKQMLKGIEDGKVSSVKR